MAEEEMAALEQSMNRTEIIRLYHCGLVTAALFASCGHQQRTDSVTPPAGPIARVAPATKGATRHVHPSQILSRKALRADLDQLVSYLENAHPDPYFGGGGRVAFHERVARLRMALPPGGLTQEGFFRLVAPLVASVQDGHTTVRLPRSSLSSESNRERAWIDLDVAGDTIFVSKAYGPARKQFLGREVVAMGGVHIGRLAQRMKQLRGADNHYQNLVHLMQVTEHIEWLPLLFESPQLPKTLHLTLRDPSSSKTDEVHILIGHQAPGPALGLPTTLPLPALNAADIGWGFVGREGKVAVLRVRSMMRYREAFEIWRGTRNLRNRREHLESVVRAAIGDKAAARLTTLDQKVAAIPAAAEAMTGLVKAMSQGGVKKLIVDLRDNGGGNSFIVQILQAALFGRGSVGNSQRGYQVPRLSRLYFDNYKVDPGAELDRRGLGGYGDYDFSEKTAWQRRNTKGRGTSKRELGKGWVSRATRLSPTFAQLMKTSADRPALTPSDTELVVLTSARTYSAGFDMAALLHSQGATLVGVASSQAANCYIDTLGYSLKNSGLTGGISYKKSRMFPLRPREGKTLVPDIEMRHSDLAQHKMDRNTPVILALNALEQNEKERKTTRKGRVRFRWKGATDGALALLRHRYGLPAITGGTKDELLRLTRLRDWVHHRWGHHSTNRPNRQDALSILAEAEQGRRFRCVEYSIVLAQVYRAVGYCARLVRLQGQGAHVLTEVFAPSLGKWILMDGQFNAQVLRGNVPVNVYDLIKTQRSRPVEKEGSLQAMVGGKVNNSYLKWLAPYLRVVMVPRDMSYGRELEEVVVLLPKGADRLRVKPPYLRRTRYVYANEPGDIYPTCSR